MDSCDTLFSDWSPINCSSILHWLPCLCSSLHPAKDFCCSMVRSLIVLKFLSSNKSIYKCNQALHYNISTKSHAMKLLKISLP